MEIWDEDGEEARGLRRPMHDTGGWRRGKGGDEVVIKHRIGGRWR